MDIKEGNQAAMLYGKLDLRLVSGRAELSAYLCMCYMNLRLPRSLYHNYKLL